jgi:N-acetylglucosaminyldiphosphoundecaprenol N-acetyl-beta-D-mannosaminyltransferase
MTHRDIERDAFMPAGLPIARVTRGETVDGIFSALTQGRGGWLLTATVDYLRQCTEDSDLQQLCSTADLIVADGMPLLWAARIHGSPLPDRVAGSDLVWLLAEGAALEGRSLYLLGGEPGAAEGARQRLQARWPTLRVVGVQSPRLSPTPTRAQLDLIDNDLRRATPDLVYVALGVPKQDRVIHALRQQHPNIWFVGVGISLSFIAGKVRRAPAWMQVTGLEWLHRLLQEPRRLGRRYVIEDLPFLVRLLARTWGSRRRE